MRIIGQKRSDIAEEIIYRGIINGSAITPNMATLISINAKRIYRPWFPLSFRFVILRENSGILLTINNDNITVRIIRSSGEFVTVL
jgi:hypothetical protein